MHRKKLQNNKYTPIEDPKPLYQQVKSHVLQHIQNGDWEIHGRIPSEHELVATLSMSRMTIHRALRELTQEGILKRVQGLGTFVAAPKQMATTLSLPNIEEYVTSRGNRYSCTVQFHQTDPVTPEDALKLGLKEGADIYRSYLIHKENNLPIMLEDRYTLPDRVPDYINQDFTKILVDSFFAARCPFINHDHQLSVQMSTQEIHHFMELDHPTPCLHLYQRTWSGDKLLSAAKFLYPGGHFALSC
ncbi:MAG: UTRA domain-containing protein [Sneathiella sp.]|nr:UTRA domain-containing protein [Sneathiella sp.]